MRGGKRAIEAAQLAIALAWPLILGVFFLTDAIHMRPAVARAAERVAVQDGAARRTAPPRIQLRALPQPASVSATPRLRLPTGTPPPGLPPVATGTAQRVISTASPLTSATPDSGGTGGGAAGGGTARPGAAGTPGTAGTAGTGNTAGTVGTAAVAPATAPGAAAAGTAASGATQGDGGVAGAGAPGPAGAAPPAGGRVGDPPGRSGNSRAVTDSAPAPSGLFSPPAEDPGIRRVWAVTGSPRIGQSWLARLTADRPGPWGWGLSYALLALAFLWAFRRVWGSIEALRGADAGRTVNAGPGGTDAQRMVDRQEADDTAWTPGGQERP